MRLGIFAILYTLTAFSAAGEEFRAVDGDTVVIRGETIRIYNIDTPEIGQAKCDDERLRGLIAKARMEEIIKSGEITLQRGDHKRMRDRHGRTLARVLVNGHDAGEMMIDEGLARKWNGKRRPWC